jgi:hypothetical protein
MGSPRCGVAFDPAGLLIHRGNWFFRGLGFILFEAMLSSQSGPGDQTMTLLRILVRPKTSRGKV